VRDAGRATTVRGRLLGDPRTTPTALRGLHPIAEETLAEEERTRRSAWIANGSNASYAGFHRHCGSIVSTTSMPMGASGLSMRRAVGPAGELRGLALLGDVGVGKDDDRRRGNDRLHRAAPIAPTLVDTHDLALSNLSKSSRTASANAPSTN